jgi:hypothetical protein
VRPSKPSPKTMSGLAFAQVPKSEVLVGVAVADVVAGGAASVLDAAGAAAAADVSAGGGAAHSVGASSAAAAVVDEAGGAAAAVVDEAGGAAAAVVVVVDAPVPVPVPALPLPTAAAISSAVTSGTRRFWVKIHPTGSLASSPGEPRLARQISSAGAVGAGGTYRYSLSRCCRSTSQERKFRT